MLLSPPPPQPPGLPTTPTTKYFFCTPGPCSSNHQVGLQNKIFRRAATSSPIPSHPHPLPFSSNPTALGQGWVLSTAKVGQDSSRETLYKTQTDKAPRSTLYSVGPSERGHYQGTVVAGVFGGQVCDGGGDAGGQQQHALSEVAVVELAQHLLVPVINTGWNYTQANKCCATWLCKLKNLSPRARPLLRLLFLRNGWTTAGEADKTEQL